MLLYSDKISNDNNVKSTNILSNFKFFQLYGTTRVAVFGFAVGFLDFGRKQNKIQRKSAD